MKKVFSLLFIFLLMSCYLQLTGCITCENKTSEDILYYVNGNCVAVIKSGETYSLDLPPDKYELMAKDKDRKIIMNPEIIILRKYDNIIWSVN